MPRSIWNGTIVFGMVRVPVKLYTATESKTVHFHEVHAKDGARIEHRRVCPREDREVPAGEIVKGFEVAPDEYVVLTKEEVKAAAGERGKVMHLEAFVDVAAIDPVFYENSYFVGSRDDAGAYRLLHDALRRSRRAGIGRFSFHDREYLLALRAFDGVLALHTMRFHDEVVRGDELDIARSQRRPSKRELDMANRLVDALEQDFDPAAYRDTYRESVLKLIKRKAAGRRIDVAPPEEPAQADDDLTAALEASLSSAGR
ncbi:MAG TPA: Ku protein [Solirubrobacteraceae bacterium]|nr:Ku protein [Solirubrobacteraceae bacterium]